MFADFRCLGRDICTHASPWIHQCVEKSSSSGTGGGGDGTEVGGGGGDGEGV